MDEQCAEVVVPFRPQIGGASAVDEMRKSGRFCAWRGASGRRYVATVYPVDRSGADLGLPGFRSFVLLAVARNGTCRHVLDVAVIEPGAGRRAALTAGLARGADEWHVHFLADDPPARAAMVADLRARHGCAAKARCA